MAAQIGACPACTAALGERAAIERTRERALESNQTPRSVPRAKCVLGRAWSCTFPYVWLADAALLVGVGGRECSRRMGQGTRTRRRKGAGDAERELWSCMVSICCPKWFVCCDRAIDTMRKALGPLKICPLALPPSSAGQGGGVRARVQVSSANVCWMNGWGEGCDDALELGSGPGETQSECWR
ncbi:hypothetical protein L226DRAFT_244808 [Lentinus tigrinus ALCF2SS1-7]|uniref:Uncharacterized protein n=1 Tax=Lentinus tigrinus ALCF2SS1-6 TaxID=1328759 RepID=A0A5C2SQI3_9APHY|nr:hypothetical protein L227DRAFT_209066 [Lentinus tigrinus ALCF2SS1-6]RPD79241.1 hypothetical protein L226DRAFT_244808 [Lentinus tigrinus ALCF2SS1-7]